MKHLKLLFRSLWKNDACVEGGLHYKWWVALIFFFLSSIISIIPVTVQTLTVDAGTFITQASMDLDKAWEETLRLMKNDYKFDLEFHNDYLDSQKEETQTEEKKDQNAYITLKGEWPDELIEKDKDGNPVLDGAGNKKRLALTISQKNIAKPKPEEKPSEETTKPSEETAAPSDTTAVVQKANDQKPGHPTKPEETEQNFFTVYFFEDLTGRELRAKINYILTSRNGYDYVDPEIYAPEDGKLPETDKTMKTSFAVFGKEAFGLYKYNAAGKAIGSLAGTYQHIKINTLTELLKDTPHETMEQSALFLNDAFYPLKMQNGGVQIGIYAAINSGMIFLMGLVFFLMTRGKNHPLRFYKFDQCLNISTWLSFTPAVLALIFGFIFTQNGIGAFMFILTFGMRSMWLSMKQLRPQ